MSEGRFTFRIPRGLYQELCARAHEEELSPDEVMTAWVKRAVRQEGSVLPRSEPAEGKARVLTMDRRDG